MGGRVDIFKGQQSVEQKGSGRWPSRLDVVCEHTGPSRALHTSFNFMAYLGNNLVCRTPSGANRGGCSRRRDWALPPWRAEETTVYIPVTHSMA